MEVDDVPGPAAPQAQSGPDMFHPAAAKVQDVGPAAAEQVRYADPTPMAEKVWVVGLEGDIGRALSTIARIHIDATDEGITAIARKKSGKRATWFN